MRCVIISKPGGPEVLEATAREKPAVGPDELLIRVIAAGVNRPDIAQRKGHYPPPSWAPPDIPGLEVSGIVEATGEHCIRYQIGDQVCALVSGGGYAELAVAKEGHTLPAPAGWSLEEAATLPETTFTVWQNVFDKGNLAAGESILIHGGTSGIGITAIQMCKAAGATVYVTCGTDIKCQKALEIGADHAICHTTEDFREKVIALTRKAGVNLVLDMVGGSYFQRNLDCLALDGRLLMINFMGGDEAMIRSSTLLRKRLTISGNTLRNQDHHLKAKLADSVFNHVYPWIEAGKFRPVIDSQYPLAKAANAHRRMESGEHMGKILLVTA